MDDANPIESLADLEGLLVWCHRLYSFLRKLSLHQGVHVGGQSLGTARNQHGGAPTDPLGFSSDPVELDYDEWKEKHGVQERMTNCYGLTNCMPVFVSQDRCDVLVESDGRYYMWARDGNIVVRILHDLEEIKQIITDWGQGALSMEYLGPV